MSMQPEEMHRELDRIFNEFPEIRKNDIPGIDLYMDQVTTFLQENLRGLSRDPDGDKFLTKTMINNYVKNKVLIPPVKKKYSRDHMMLLIMIYYMKSFLSISDIRSITTPVMERYAAQTPDQHDRKKEAPRKEAPIKVNPASSLRIGNIYEAIADSITEDLPQIRRDIAQQIDFAADDFAGVPEEDRPILQRFSLICRLSAEVYMRKLFIEKLLDADS